MNRVLHSLSPPAVAVLLALAPVSVIAQQGLTWDQVKARFEASNPLLKADADNVAEMKAEEITAYLRPNPQMSMTLDQTYPFGKHYDPNIPGSAYRPLSDALTTGNISYLHEREHKRELRLQSAQEGTRITQSEHEDLERNLVFALRTAFVNTLQAKFVLNLAQNDLEYYDKIIDISQHRFNAGDIAQVDLDRIELQRVQYESELQTALVNLRTAKIQLLQMLNDRTPIDQFELAGAFDFSDALQPLETYRDAALAARPDLQAVLQTIQQSQTNHKLAIANGSTDPTFMVDGGANPPLGPYIGANVTIPLRIFDHNQGERQRTQIDIDRATQAAEGSRAQVFSDVDTSYELVRSNIALLKPYKAKYNDQATHVRDTVSYSYLHGGASLMDFLSAQSDYRQVQLAYAQLIGAYLTAAGQLNLAVGREVIP